MILGLSCHKPDLALYSTAEFAVVTGTGRAPSADNREVCSNGKSTSDQTCLLSCLLSLVTLERRVVWVYYAAVGAILALAAVISAMIVCDQGGWMVRFAGAVAILDGCLSLCIPVLHRLGSALAVPTAAETSQQIELICPRCGLGGHYPIGSIRCRRCSLAIDIRIEADSHTGRSQ
jgi:hypothetical protein